MMIAIPIIKPTSTYCNLRCRYCFYRHTNQADQGKVMNTQVLVKLIKETLKVNPKLAEFDWLGGEPTLAGLDFFQEVIELQRKYCQDGQVIVNKLQTNGILINEPWVRFLVENNVHIGVSIDGPKNFHDVFRLDDKGRGTHDRVMEAIHLLQSRGYQKWGTITVASRANVDYPEEVYNFFITHGIKRLAFNPVKGLDPKTLLLLEAAPKIFQYAGFMKKVFDYWWENDDPSIVIRQFHSIIQGLLGGRYRLCTFSGQCQRFFSVDYDGNIYPCEDDIPTKDLCFGNIEEGWKVVLGGEKYQQYCRLITDLRQDCKQCQWYNICRGGCTRYYNILIKGIEQKNSFCEAEKAIFQHISNQLDITRIKKETCYVPLGGRKN